MKKHIMELFKLQGLIADRMEVNDENIIVHVRHPRIRARCLLCGKRTKRVHDTRRRRVRHDVWNERRVFLSLSIRRFLCTRHGPFMEPHVLGIARGRFTEHFKDRALALLSTTNFKATGERYRVSASALLAFLAERKAKLPWPKGNIVLNIDEHSYRGRDLKISIGDATHRKLMDILADDRKETLLRYLKGIPSDVQSRISEVAIDMKASYRAAIEECLPQSIIVVDRFHVMQALNCTLDELRKILQPEAVRGARRINRMLLLKNGNALTGSERLRLRMIFAQYEKFPALRGCYVVKERMRAMYACATRTQAEKIFGEIMLILEEYEVGVLADTRDMLSRWKPYILNFFISRTTNAYIEGCHNKIKLIKRMSYGFRNFDNYVLKITLAFLPFLFLPPH